MKLNHKLISNLILNSPKEISDQIYSKISFEDFEKYFFMILIKIARIRLLLIIIHLKDL